MNAGALVAVAAMVVWFGVRPGLKMALLSPRLAATGDAHSYPTAKRRPWARPTATASRTRAVLIETNPGRDEFLQALLARRDNGPERKLLKLVDFDEAHAATILKQWIREGANG